MSMFSFQVFYFIYLFPFVNNTLIIVWGQPAEWDSCAENTTNDWDDCMVECESDDYCIFTYMNESICYLCQIGQIDSMVDESATKTTKIAFKANTSLCSPSPMTEYFTSDYTVSLANNYWTFSYNSLSTTDGTTPSTIVEKCPEGWTLFTRVMGIWCMRVYSGSISQREAGKLCEEQGGKLSGIETSQELAFIISGGVEVVKDLIGNITEGALYIGAARVSECKGSEENSTGCVPWANNAYEWTDGFTTGKDMMVWMQNQPDYALQSEDCVQIVIVYQAQDFSLGTISGQLDDISCTVYNSTSSLNHIRGYVCGLQATTS